MDLSFKTWVARALEGGGVLALAQNLMRSRRQMVFALHRVLPREEMAECYNPYLATSPESLDHLLRWLRARWAIVSLDELLAMHASGSDSAACTLTFDDGWEDNHRCAFPVLQAHGATALIYLVTDLIGHNELFPEERLWRILRSESLEERDHIEKLLAAQGYSGVLSRFKEMPYAQKVSFLQGLRTQAGTLTSRFLDWDQVLTMHKTGISFGSHTRHHVILPNEDDAVVKDELTNSKQYLVQKLGLKSVHFAFPSGRHDSRTIRAVREAGYASAATTRVGVLRNPQDDFAIPRLPMDNSVVNDTQNKFSSSRAWYSIVRGMLGHRVKDGYRSEV